MVSQVCSASRVPSTPRARGDRVRNLKHPRSTRRDTCMQPLTRPGNEVTNELCSSSRLLRRDDSAKLSASKEDPASAPRQVCVLPSCGRSAHHRELLLAQPTVLARDLPQLLGHVHAASVHWVGEVLVHSPEQSATLSFEGGTGCSIQDRSRAGLQAEQQQRTDKVVMQELQDFVHALADRCPDVSGMDAKGREIAPVLQSARELQYEEHIALFAGSVGCKGCISPPLEVDVGEVELVKHARQGRNSHDTGRARPLQQRKQEDGQQKMTNVVRCKVHLGNAINARFERQAHDTGVQNEVVDRLSCC
mmetsp:Transcript_2860/g.8724  ORF Transcript_2860/g.8724 Transcript_2860/m.8724 type:complete len:306 (-) Transcript_2860:415-1332(-)